MLEERQLLSAAPADTVFQDLVSVDVVGRQLFYNNSSFDGNNPAANAADDAAIAAGKAPLFPGNTATFANYSSYSRGINGVMVDIAGLPSATLTAADFAFRVGNTNDPQSWTAAPTPQITLRLGAGVDGSARVELIWPDGAIVGQWLEVTVKATPRTGLAADDVFYYGNAIGETGNQAGNAIVDAADSTATQNNPRDSGNPAPIDFAYDFNRDGLVDTDDVTIAATHGTTQATALQLINPATMQQPPPDQQPPSPLFNWGDSGYEVPYAPVIVTTNAGTVLAFSEGRLTRIDGNSYAIIVRRSTDGGATFSPAVPVYDSSVGTSYNRINAGSAVVDRDTGKIFYVFMRYTVQVLVTESSNDGLSWSTPKDITSTVKITGIGNQGPPVRILRAVGVGPCMVRRRAFNWSTANMPAG